MSPNPASPTRPSPSDLQSHLYTSFLQRKTADVALRISGSWNAIYRLHRVILIQAGFFQSLFTSGFSESTSKLYRHHGNSDCIDIVFDDPNITRAAFELCIARLYGGGPRLWISPSLIPTPAHPLTPPFSSNASDLPPPRSPGPFPPGLDISTSATLPPDHQPASPRFLLSLLSTAVYLSMPSIASQALSAIVRTVGPHTAIRYLNFSLGRGIGDPEDLTSFGIGPSPESRPAVGLEEVAELVKEEDLSSFYDSIDASADPANTSINSIRSRGKGAKHSRNCSGPPSSDSESDTEAEALKASTSSSRARRESRGKFRAVSIGSNASFAVMAGRDEPCYYYGAVSDKVGEAAACWLTRWGVDMLRCEEQAQDEETQSGDVLWSPVTSQNASETVERPGSAPPDITGSRLSRRSGGKPTPIPVVWRVGGLDARWVRGILSSDALFVKGEKERYEVARRVVEMRRGSRTPDRAEDGRHEEAEFEKLFNDGIYYSTMHMDDLMQISKDVSPSTGKPFVSLALLQAALWNQSTLSHRITYRPPGSSSPSLSPTDTTKVLGVGVAAAEVEQHAQRPDDLYYPIPGDSSLRLGDSTGLEGASMDQLFEVGNTKKGAPQPTEANFFGLEPLRQPASELVTSSVSSSSSSSLAGPQGKWTTHPPFRFAVEFWDVDALKEKSRLHSHTVWYAGSLYNVYVQVVRKKGVQLGIYLHRQSVVDPIPPSSAPVARMVPSISRESRLLGRGASSSVSSPRSPLAGTLGHSPKSPSLASFSSRTQSPIHATPGTPIPGTPTLSRMSTATHLPTASVGTLPATAPPAAPIQPYRDPRPAVCAYFTIACASATGASLTRFTSAPDTFSVSQSWGWKSSSLRTEEYLEVDADGQPVPVVMPAGREVSLRATVVLGVV